MKKIFLLILFCFPVLLFGQRYVKGRVIDSATNNPIWYAEIGLIGSDGTDIKAYTDSMGYYKIDSNHLSPKISYVISVKKDEWGPYYCGSLGQNIPAAGNIQIDTATINFSLKRWTGIICRTLPSVRFLKNSCQVSQGGKDSVLDLLYRLLNSNIAVVIELDGHTDQKELNPTELSLKRAQACKDYLISKGIDSARLVIKGWGSKRPIIEKRQISCAITQAQKDSLYQINRRAVFQIISWDYSKK